MSEAPSHFADEAEYLELLAASPDRLELFDGVVVAMTGASKRHNEVGGNLYVALRGIAGTSGCRVFIEGVRLRAANSRHYFPDVMVACEPSDNAYAEDRPCLLAEVLSPSTRWFDDRHKRVVYLELASLRHYLVIDTEQELVEHHHRSGADEEWSLSIARRGDTLTLQCPKGTLTVDEILASA